MLDRDSLRLPGRARRVDHIGQVLRRPPGYAVHRMGPYLIEPYDRGHPRAERGSILLVHDGPAARACSSV